MDFISLSFFTRNLFCQSVEKQYLRTIKLNVISSFFLYFNHKSILVISYPHFPSQHMNCGFFYGIFGDLPKKMSLLNAQLTF